MGWEKGGNSTRSGKGDHSSDPEREKKTKKKRNKKRRTSLDHLLN